MIVKQSNKTQKKLFLKRSKKIGSIATLFLGVFCTSALSYSISPEKNQVQIKSLISKIKVLWNTRFPFPRPAYKQGDMNEFGLGFFEGKPDFPGIKRISLNIKHKHWESLKIYREQSLKAKRFIRYKNPYVPAKVRYQNKAYKARIRFKGAIIDHIMDEKWSFRIILKGKNTLFGMKQFSVQHPSQRTFLYEKFIHLAMKREGLLGLRYDFIYLTINGKNMGLYALEEHFEKRLVENNRRINGPILKFASSLTKYDAAKSESVKKKPALFQQYEKAKGILAALIVGELTVEQVFDLKKLAKFAALIDLLAAYHGAHSSSSRMYYNPVTSRLEIFSYDNLSIGYFQSLIGAGRSYFQKAKLPQYGFYNILFNDPAFFKEYIKALEQVTKKTYLDKMLSDLKNVIDRDEKLLQSEWYNFGFTKHWMFDKEHYHPSSVDFFYQNQKEIQEILSAKRTIKAYYQNNQNKKTVLAVKNISPMPIEVLGIFFQNTLHPPTKKTILPVKPFDGEAKVRLVNFPKLGIEKRKIPLSS